jgi:hypothetical protein
MFLQDSICREIKGSILRALQILCALSAAESLLGMNSALVRSEVACGFKRHLAFLASSFISMCARKGFLVQMHRQNVFL